jgi:hypothetical protein
MAAGVDADYFGPNSEFGRSASGRDADKWAPLPKQFMDGLKKQPSLRGAQRRSNPCFLCAVRWIASLRSQ